MQHLLLGIVFSFEIESSWFPLCLVQQRIHALRQSTEKKFTHLLPSPHQFVDGFLLSGNRDEHFGRNSSDKVSCFGHRESLLCLSTLPVRATETGHRVSSSTDCGGDFKKNFGLLKRGPLFAAADLLCAALCRAQVLKPRPNPAMHHEQISRDADRRTVGRSVDDVFQDRIQQRTLEQISDTPVPQVVVVLVKVFTHSSQGQGSNCVLRS